MECHFYQNKFTAFIIIFFKKTMFAPTFLFSFFTKLTKMSLFLTSVISLGRETDKKTRFLSDFPRDNFLVREHTRTETHTQPSQKISLISSAFFIFEAPQASSKELSPDEQVLPSGWRISETRPLCTVTPTRHELWENWSGTTLMHTHTEGRFSNKFLEVLNNVEYPLYCYYSHVRSKLESYNL